jgi:hypothetical protein
MLIDEKTGYFPQNFIGGYFPDGREVNLKVLSPPYRTGFSLAIWAVVYENER